MLKLSFLLSGTQVDRNFEEPEGVGVEEEQSLQMLCKMSFM